MTQEVKAPTPSLLKEVSLLSVPNLNSALTLMTLLIPYLFIVGYFANQGYLIEFGLSDQFFPKTIQNYLTSAFLFFGLSLMNLLTAVGSLTFISVAAVFVVIPTYIASSFYFEGREVDLSNSWMASIKDRYMKHLDLPISSIYFSIKTTAILSCLVFVFLGIPTYGYKHGQTVAKEKIKAFTECKLQTRSTNQSCIYGHQKEKITFSGALIEKSATHIAIWDGQATKVHDLKDITLTIRKAHKPE